jgi:MSHA biogenesis protein MshJ
MSDKFKKLMERIDSLSLRERGMLLGTLVFVIYSAWNGLFMGPLTAHHKLVQGQIKQLRGATAQLSQQSEDIVKRQSQDPNAETTTKLASLRTEVAALDERIKARTQGLIDPASMAKMLEDVLKNEPGLKLLSVQSLPASPLLDTEVHDADKPAHPNAGVPGIYRHGMTLVFEGGYLDALHYLRTLEALPWHLYWDNVAFKVGKYPLAQFTITVHTIGLREGWIGV